MSDRAELVTAALLGTDRRSRTTADPAAEADPAHDLLDRAVRSAVAHRAGRLLPTAPPAPRAPPESRVLAAPEAQAILRRILDPPQIELVNIWLAAAAACGVGVSPEHWTELVRLAARSADVDRGDLAAALGARGLWFVAQNAQWSRLESALRRPPAPTTSAPGSASDATAIVRAEIHNAFQVPPTPDPARDNPEEPR